MYKTFHTSLQWHQILLSCFSLKLSDGHPLTYVILYHTSDTTDHATYRAHGVVVRRSFTAREQGEDQGEAEQYHIPGHRDVFPNLVSLDWLTHFTLSPVILLWAKSGSRSQQNLGSRKVNFLLQSLIFSQVNWSLSKLYLRNQTLIYILSSTLSYTLSMVSALSGRGGGEGGGWIAGWPARFALNRPHWLVRWILPPLFHFYCL